MNILKVFEKASVFDIETDVNNFLSANPDVKIVNMFATEIVMEGINSYSTLYLLLEVPSWWPPKAEETLDESDDL